jgi:hypothetical protein
LWRKNNREKREISRIKYRFGLDTDEALYWYKKAEKVCDACGEKDEFRRLNIDHDHETGKVRGVLCHGCNIVLGLAKDNSRRLRKLAEYLDAS